MAIDDPFHQAQAQAGAIGAGRARGVGLIEALEDVRDDVRAPFRSRCRRRRRGALTVRRTRTTTQPPSGVNFIALSSRLSSSRSSHPASPGRTPR